MKHHWFNAVLIFTVLFTLSIAECFAQGGDGKGNGGIAVVCRDKKGKVQTAELLDLFEARNDSTLRISLTSRPSLSEADWMKEVIQRLDSMKTDQNLFKRIAFDLRFFNKQIQSHLLPLANSAVGLSLPTDFHPRVIPQTPNCKIESAVKYLNAEMVQVDQEIIKEMLPMDRSALWVHEALYKAARENEQAKNSDQVRVFVAKLFSLTANDTADDLDWRAILEKNISVESEINDGIILRGYSDAPYTALISFSLNLEAGQASGSSFTINSLYPASDHILGIPSTEVSNSLRSLVLNATNDGKEHHQTIRINKNKCSLQDQRFWIETEDLFGVSRGFVDMQTLNEVHVDLKMRKL